MNTIDNIGVYKITNLTNNKFYIGGTLNLKLRQRHHFWRTSNPILSNAMIKNGKENFTFNVLEYCYKDTVWTREQYYLDLYFDNTNLCYNICPIAKSRTGVPLSEESKRKISETKKSQHLHNQISEETKIKMSLSHIGKKVNAKELERIRSFRHTEESNIKNRNAHIKVRPYKLISPNGEIFEGKNIRVFCEQNNLTSNKIWLVIIGERLSHKGWTSAYNEHETIKINNDFPIQVYNKIR